MSLTTENIPYFEYRAINELREAHKAQSGDDLVAFVVFGELITTGDSYDIHILEVVRNWSGPRHLTFTSSEALYLRGSLFLNFFTPEEFEGISDPSTDELHGSDASLLLEQMRSGYTVMYESEAGYVRRILDGSQISARSDSGNANPLSIRELASVS